MARYETDWDVLVARNAVLADNWWVLALRGVLAILFSIIAIAAPGPTMLGLVLVFAAYSTLDGISNIVLAVRGARKEERWALLLLNGLFGVTIGVAAALWPGLTVLAFVCIIGAWAVVSGGLTLGAAYNLKVSHGRWLLVLSAVVSLIYGVLLLISPLIGALVLTWWVAIHAVIYGATLLSLAFRLRTHRGERTSGPLTAAA